MRQINSFEAVGGSWIRGILLGALMAIFCAGPAYAEHDNVRGWVEPARVMPLGLLLNAKLDSGAKTTSIHAEILAGDARADAEDQAIASEADNMESFRKDAPPDDPNIDLILDVVDAALKGDEPKSIVFRVTSKGGQSRILRRDVVRWVDIRRRGGGTIRRPVVRMAFCIAGLWTEGEVNLADRSGFNYPLLVGRNMLSQTGIIIDSRRVYTQPSACSEPSDASAATR